MPTLEELDQIDAREGEVPEPTEEEAAQLELEVPFDPGVVPDRGFLERAINQVGDIASGAAQGFVKAVDEAGDLGTSLLDEAGIPSVVTIGPDGISLTTQEEADKIAGRADLVKGVVQDFDPKTTAGGITSGISQFVTSFLGAGKVFKGLKFAKDASFGANAIRGAVRGSIADFVGFDGREDRLSDFINEFPALRNPVTEYLAADPKDSEAFGRLKNSVEGLLLGAVVAEPVALLFRHLKNFRRISKEQGQEAGEKYLEDNADELTDIQTKVDEADLQTQGELFDDTADLGAVAKSDEDILAEKAANDATEAKRLRVTITKVEREVSDGVRPLTPELRQALADAKISVTNFNRGVRGATEEFITGRPVFDQEAAEAAVRFPGVDGIEALERAENLWNFSKMDSVSSIHDAMRAVAPLVRREMDKQVQAGTKSHAQVQRQAVRQLDEVTDLGADVILANAAKLARSADEMDATLISAKMMVQSLGREVTALVRKLDEGGLSDLDKAKLALHMQQWLDLQASLGSIRKAAARTTAAGRIRTKDFVDGEKLNTAAIVDLVQRSGGDEKLRKLAEALKGADGDAGAMNKIIKKTFGRRAVDMLLEYYINSLLSGPKTHIVNAASNLTQTFLLPTEKIIGGVVGGQFGLAQEGTRQLLYNFMAMKESGILAMRALRVGENVLDTRSMLEPGDLRHAIDSEADHIGGKVLRTTGTIVRMPSRLLQTSDEFFKQVNYRSALKARLMVEAQQRFPIALGLSRRERQLRVQQRMEWVEEEFQKGFDVDGRGIDAEALQYAREATFTQDLEFGIGRSVQQFTQKHPLTRLVLPFVRTPTNLIRFSMQRTPLLGMAQREMRADLAAGGHRRARAIGKQAMGMALTGMAVTAAAEGRITGGGPADPAQRANLMRTGWRPYSFVVDNPDGSKSYIGFNRMDPIAQFFGIAADYMNIANNLNDDSEAEEIVTAFAIATARNITSKSYLQGLADALNAMNKPDQAFSKWVQNMAGGFVPTGAKQISEFAGFTDDPHMREVRGIVDKALSRIPGLSTTLPPKMDWVTGEPVSYPEGFIFPDSISPFPRSNRQFNRVAEEMARLQHGFTQPERSVEGLELSEQEYAEYLRLHGKVQIGGRTMAERLDQLFKSSSYRRASDNVDPELSGKVKMARRVISAYRKKAFVELRKQNEELREKFRTSRRERRIELRGSRQEDDLDKRVRDLLRDSN